MNRIKSIILLGLVVQVLLPTGLLWGFLSSPLEVAKFVHRTYRCLKEPEISSDKEPVVVYGPPATFWVAEGERRLELRVPETIPLEDTIGNFLLRGKLKRHAKNPNKSWLSPGYGIAGILGLAVLLVRSSLR